MFAHRSKQSIEREGSPHIEKESLSALHLTEDFFSRKLLGNTMNMNEKKYTVQTLVMDISSQFSKEETQKAKEYLS